MTTVCDFYETETANQMTKAYNQESNNQCCDDTFFLVCIFLALNI